MKIFISWSKQKSRRLAEATKKFIISVLGDSVQIFFSPDMYRGSCVDNEIHNNLLCSDKCIVCITSENYKNPWLMYEAGVVYGTHYATPGSNVVIPILFEHVPEWSSWVDKPLNRYAPIDILHSHRDFQKCRTEIKRFLEELAQEVGGVKLSNFTKNWNIYENNIREILNSEKLIPESCRDLVEQIMHDEGNFTIISPDITKDHIIFHKGFSTTALMKILLNNIVNFQGKRLWIFGRRNKKLMTSENDFFFIFLAQEGIKNGVDFKCLFPYPETDATYRAVSKDKERRFKNDLQTSLEAAVRFQNRFNLPVSKIFRLYRNRRNDSVIISDDAVLHSHIICDSEGYPLPMTNSPFEILTVSEDGKGNKGKAYYEKFVETWGNAIPLTEEVYNEIYGL